MSCRAGVIKEAVDGLLLLDKPSGPTSHDLVASVRRLSGSPKAGHTGTLDPMASGLLIILVGKATKLAPFVPGDPKVYEGCILLGLSTDSMDIEGEVIAEGTYDGGPERAQAALASLVGVVEQVPPMFSAVKYRGKPLYRYARMGEEVPRQSRTVRVYRSEMRAFRVRGTRAEMDFLIECSPGTYVRDLAARVGDGLGCGGTLSRLRRMGSGPFGVEDAMSVEEMRERAVKGRDYLLPLERAVEGCKRVDVAESGLIAVRNGSPLGGSMLRRVDAEVMEGDAVAVFAGGELIGMHRVSQVSPFISHALRMM
jgi:tRNA pseudouridine55 synthase